MSRYFPVIPLTPSLSLVKYLNALEQFEEAAGSQDDVRVEAAHVITSLSYGSQPLLRSCGCLFYLLIFFAPLPEALRSILHANAHRAFFYAISCFVPTESPTTKAAFARALRVIAAACAGFVGALQ